MANTPAELQDKLRQLQLAYASKLPAKMETIEKITDYLVHHRLDRDMLENLHQMAHTLAGSGAVFGLVTIGDKARALEQTIVSLLSAQALPSETVKELETRVQDLKQASLTALKND